MTKVKIGSWLFLLILIAVMAFAGQNKGAKEMTLEGGKPGKVPFPHSRHQEMLSDCNACHSLFPQEPDVIEALKAQGKLKKKKVMKQCQKCHRERARAGEKAGPITCKGCHVK